MKRTTYPHQKRLTAILSAVLCMTLMLPACTPGGTDTPTEAPGTQPAAPSDSDTQTSPSDTDAPETEEPETLPPDLEDVDLSIGQDFLCLRVGDTAAVDSNIASDKYAVMDENVLYAAGDHVLSYADGQITALGGGCAYLVLSNRYTGKSDRLLVRVIDPAREETCIIGAPIWDYRFMNETQMQYLADAHFNSVFMSHAPDDDIIAFFGMAEPYGITVYPQLATPTVDELSMDDETIRARIDKFKQYPAFGGFNLRDEPSYFFDDYARVAQFVHDYDPSLIAMINFLPDAARTTLYNYGSRLHDDDYSGVLSFDNYIFPPAAGSVSETWLFRNFELYRQAGIDNRCRTAFYLQSIGSGTYGYRRPDEGTMFYHAMVSLAYGCTMMRYFSYVTPNLTEYTSGVIDYDGNPTDLYDVSIELNKEYASYGLWLIHANADEVYHTGPKLDAGADYRIVPDDCWITPRDETEAKKRTILTTFTDRASGQNYLMVVNKDFSAPVTVTYTLKDVPYLYAVDPDTGYASEIDVSDGSLTVALEKGRAALFVLPAGKTYTTPSTPAVNLAADAYVTVSSVSDGSGSCVEYLFDGRTISADGCTGWQAMQDTDGAWVKLEFDAPTTFDRLDLYPAGNGPACGRFFPASAELQVEDGDGWRTVVTIQKPAVWESGVSVTFDAVTARRVRLFVPTLYRMADSYRCEIGELCLFHDDGSLPGPDKTDWEPLKVDPGVNVALGKKCCDYSSVQNTLEWHEHEIYLTDGDNSQKDYYAYSSAACRNGNANAHEYFILDLENVYPINKIVLYPNFDGTGFPRAYTVEVSADGVNWTVVQEVTRGKPNKGEVVTIEFDTLEAAYIKLDATTLTLEANPAAQYVLQIAELEAYTPEQ